MTIDERIARLRALAVSILAEKRLGVDVSPREAEGLAATNSINEALILLQRRVVRKPFAYTSPNKTPRIISGPTGGGEGLTHTKGEPAVIALPRHGRFRYPEASKSLVAGPRVSLMAICALWISGVWSYLVVTTALQATVVNGWNMSNAVFHTAAAALALASGIYSTTLMGEKLGVASGFQRLLLQILIGALGLIVFLAARSAEELGGFRLSGLLRSSTLLIWLSVTLLAIGLNRDRRTTAVRRRPSKTD